MDGYAPFVERIESFLKSYEPEMFSILKSLVLIQSGSHNKKGIDEAVDYIARTCHGLHVTTEIIEQRFQGNHLIVRSKGHNKTGKQILMVGHTDTVFPVDTDFNWYKEDDVHSYGPGVIDMKGGLVVGIYALKALDKLGLLEKIPISFLFNADEEIGSRSSIDIIQKEANKSAFAFVLEAGGIDNQIVTGRKGNLTIELQVEGRAGHAAFADKDKPSAILEAAHKIIDLEALNDFDKGITINVGKVDGGIGPNTIPELSTAQIDFRYVDPADLKYLEKKVFAISKKRYVPGTDCRIDFISGRPPMQQVSGNRKLYETAEKIADRLGYPVKEEFRFGVSDANFIADMHVPVLDGLGPLGARDHSRDEYMVKTSLFQRATLLTCIIIECWRMHQDNLEVI